MTQQPFSRPGAIDLSGLGRPPAPQQAAATAGAGSGAGSAGGSYSVAVTQENFQQVLQESMTAPVVLVFHSAAQAPGASSTPPTWPPRPSGWRAGCWPRWWTSTPTPRSPRPCRSRGAASMVVLDGRPVSQPIQGRCRPRSSPRCSASWVSSSPPRASPAGTSPGRRRPAAEGEGRSSTRARPAEDALAAGDIDAAVAEYQKLLDANPADMEAAGGLAIAKVMQRTQGVDLNAARAAAADNPDDVDAQTLVADLDMLGGHVEDAFTRLVDLVARTSDKDREKARDHLLGLFAAVGNDDPRVLAGRRNLASALF